MQNRLKSQADTICNKTRGSSHFVRVLGLQFASIENDIHS
mgnify:CR=1 FL=1